MSIVPAYVGASFVPDLVAQSKTIGINPLGALALFLSESSLQPHAFNQNGFTGGGGAVGINQLAGSPNKPGNWSYFLNRGVTLAMYRSLTADEQLPFAFAYWRAVMQGHGLSTVNERDLYWLNFLPATYVAGAPDDHVIVTSASGYYGPNKSLDHGGKGFITAGDLEQSLIQATHTHADLWAALAPQIAVQTPAVQTGLLAFALGGLVIGAGTFAAISYLEPKRRRAA